MKKYTEEGFVWGEVASALFIEQKKITLWKTASISVLLSHPSFCRQKKKKKGSLKDKENFSERQKSSLYYLRI